MKKFEEFRQILNEKKKENDFLEFLKYVNNDYYVHFGDSGKIHMPGDAVDYESTPLGFYAWQMNSYKKDLVIEASYAAERVKKTGEARLFFAGEIFPYAGDREYAYIVKAKSGLKWFNLRRLDDSTIKKLVSGWNKYMKKKTGATKFITIEQLKEAYDALQRNIDFQDFNRLVRDFGLRGTQYNKFVSHRIDIAYGQAKNSNHGATFGKFVYRLIVETVRTADWSTAPKVLTDIIVGAGFDAIRDDGTGTLFADEDAQVAFFHRKAFVRKAVFGHRSQFLITPENVDDVIKALNRL